MPLADVLMRNNDHKAHRAGWLRAAVLGANDGLVSISALMVGVAAASSSIDAVITAGVAGVAAGAMSMAAGEYVSVSSQTDIEVADRALELAQHEADPEGELAELAHIYEQRGLSPELAAQVARELTASDAIGTHLREELGHHAASKAQPLQAAFASAAAFLVGGAIPFLGTLWPAEVRVPAIWMVSIGGLVVAGAAAAFAAGCGFLRPTLRVVIGGSLAMLVTYGVGSLFGVAGV